MLRHTSTHTQAPRKRIRAQGVVRRDGGLALREVQHRGEKSRPRQLAKFHFGWPARLWGPVISLARFCKG